MSIVINKAPRSNQIKEPYWAAQMRLFMNIAWLSKFRLVGGSKVTELIFGDVVPVGRMGWTHPDGSPIDRIEPDCRLICRSYEGFVFSIVLECDETQHKGGTYFAYDEDQRASRLSEVLGHPVYLIRFNPDSYTRFDGKKIRSCFRRRVVISAEWNRRFLQFREKVEDLLLLPAPPNVRTASHAVEFKMFYDGCNE